MSLVASCTSSPQRLGDLLQAESIGDESRKADCCGSSSLGSKWEGSEDSSPGEAMASLRLEGGEATSAALNSAPSHSSESP